MRYIGSKSSAIPKDKDFVKRITNRSLALLMVILMCVSFLTVAQPHTHAANNWVKNWGVRGAAALELSDRAKAFYTGDETYANLSQLSGGSSYADAPSSALYAALQDLMSGKHTTVTSYNDTKEMYQYTDCQNGGGAISSFYSGVSIGPEWGSSPSWNREHTWPNSKGSGDAENDIMMLRPTASNENSGRGNTAYGESDGYYDPNSASAGNYDLRGDVARIMLYVYTRWGNTGFMWGEDGVIESQDVLLRWMAADPVDTWELGRNDAVESITGTRNVFVDYPELAFLLFGQAVPVNITTPSNGRAPSGHTCSYGAGVVTPPTCTDLGYTTYTCTDPDCGYSYTAEHTVIIPHSFVGGICSVCGAEEAAGITLVTDAAELRVGDRIVIVAKNASMALGTQNKNNRAGAVVTKTGNTVSFNDDTQIIILEEGDKAGTFAFKVDGGYLYAASSTNNYLRTESTLSNNSSWIIDIAAEGTATVKAQGTNTHNWLRYNSGYALFAVYSSGQEDILIYKLPDCNHDWTVATCTARTVCKTCGKSDGELDPTNHSGELKWTQTTEKHTQAYNCCGAIMIAEETHEWSSGICSECGYVRGTILSRLPTTANVTYLTGLTLADIPLIGGEAVGEDDGILSGTWSWAEPDTKLYVGTASCKVIFTPASAELISNSANVEVTVSAAEQTVTSEHSTPEEICAAYAGPGLEMRDMVSSNLDVLPVFSITEDEGDAYVEGTVLYSPDAGFVTVEAQFPGVDVNGDGVAEYASGSVEIHTLFTTVPMYRMYDPNSGEHFYTGSVEEVANLKAAGWNEEGVAFNFPALGPAVYRLYDGRLPAEGGSGDHLYTKDQAEIDRLVAAGWNNEGAAFNSADESGVPQYRLYNPNAHLNGTRGAWHFTSNEDERNMLLAAGWQDQGIGWYSTTK